MQVTTIGLDLANNVFQVHGITKDEEALFQQASETRTTIPVFLKA